MPCLLAISEQKLLASTGSYLSNIKDESKLYASSLRTGCHDFISFSPSWRNTRTHTRARAHTHTYTLSLSILFASRGTYGVNKAPLSRPVLGKLSEFIPVLPCFLSRYPEDCFCPCSQVEPMSVLHMDGGPFSCEVPGQAISSASSSPL